jgi:hypothetical protein
MSINYFIIITTGNDSKTVLDGTYFSSYLGPLVITMQPGDAAKPNQTVIEPLQDGPIYLERNGTFTIKNSLLVEKGTTYHAHVWVEGIQGLGPNLCPEVPIPTGDFWWTISKENLVSVPEFPLSPLVLAISVAALAGFGLIPRINRKQNLDT